MILAVCIRTIWGSIFEYKSSILSSILSQIKHRHYDVANFSTSELVKHRPWPFARERSLTRPELGNGGCCTIPAQEDSHYNSIQGSQSWSGQAFLSPSVLCRPPHLCPPLRQHKQISLSNPSSLFICLPLPFTSPPPNISNIASLLLIYWVRTIFHNKILCFFHFNG